MTAGDVILVSTVRESDQRVVAIDAPTGRVRWSGDGRVLAATREVVVTVEGRVEGKIFTWLDTASGSVHATRKSHAVAFDFLKGCVSRGARLVCATDNEIVSLVPEGGRSMLEWAETDDAAP